MKIDWAALAELLNCQSSGGSNYAKKALAEILGEVAVREAVDYYISGEPGSELARSVLWQIHPQSGMDYCYKIFKDDKDADRRRSAVELLRVVADEHALRWVLEFLNDPDVGIQIWGAGIVDQLLWSNLIEEKDCHDILAVMKIHTNVSVRERFDFISEFLADRTKTSEQAGTCDAEEAV